jgi:hypothetical protein
VFPKAGARGSSPIAGRVVPRLVSLLSSIFSDRSALEPVLASRIAASDGAASVQRRERRKFSSHPSALLHKIGSAYSEYRQGVMDYWAQDGRGTLEKMAVSLGPNTVEFLKLAYWNEVGS